MTTIPLTESERLLLLRLLDQVAVGEEGWKAKGELLLKLVGAAEGENE